MPHPQSLGPANSPANLCIVCESAEPPLARTLRGKLVHTFCQNAIRSHQFMVRNNLAVKAQTTAEFFSNLHAWRLRILPLTAALGERRTQAQRAAAQRCAVETYRLEGSTQEQLRLNMAQYISYAMFWSQNTEEQAMAWWADAIAEQESDFEDLRLGVF